MTAILEPPTTAPAEPAAPVARQRPVDPSLVSRPATTPPAPAPPAPPPPAPATLQAPGAREPRLRPTLAPTATRLIGAALVALLALSYQVEPAPDGPVPVPSLAVEILATGMTFLMVAALAGFLRGRRWALWPALAFGALMAVNVALCPTTGHHQLAAWWFTQLVLGAAMVALPAAALARTRAG